MDPIEAILGFQAYTAALQGHLANIIQNVFAKESFFFIVRVEGGPHPRPWACRSGCIKPLRSSAQQSVGIQAPEIFETENTLLPESVYMRGGVVQYILQANRHEKTVISGICYTHVTR